MGSWMLAAAGWAWLVSSVLFLSCFCLCSEVFLIHLEWDATYRLLFVFLRSPLVGPSLAPMSEFNEVSSVQCKDHMS